MLLFFIRLWLLYDNRKRFGEKIKKLTWATAFLLPRDGVLLFLKNVFTNKNPIGVCVPVSADVVTYLGIRTRLKEHHGKLQVFIGNMFNYLHRKVMVRLILRLQERQYFLLFSVYSRQLLSYEAGTKPFFCRRVDLVRLSTLSSF